MKVLNENPKPPHRPPNWLSEARKNLKLLTTFLNRRVRSASDHDRPKPNIFFYVDAVSSCNLRCPSCVVGDKNRAGQPAIAGSMAIETISRILDKAETSVNVTGLGFFNWTEPLLHPNLPALVRQVTDRKIPCWISTNLNRLIDPEALLRAAPHEIIVSLSGFHQEIYQLGHKGGDVERVKTNMKRLSEARAATNSDTYLKVVYHRYLDNEADEKLMEAYASSLGFTFSPVWAYVTSVERVLSIASGLVYSDDFALMNRLAVPLDRALKITSQHPLSWCPHIEERLVLDVKGNVMLCCASSAASSNVIGNFLQDSFEEIQRRKRLHDLCSGCMKRGVPNYFVFSESGEMDFGKLGQARRDSQRI